MDTNLLDQLQNDVFFVMLKFLIYQVRDLHEQEHIKIILR